MAYKAIGKYEPYLGKGEQSRETVSVGVQMLELVEKDFKESIINVFKE